MELLCIPSNENTKCTSLVASNVYNMDIDHLDVRQQLP